jgi:hypothetical protein
VVSSVAPKLISRTAVARALEYLVGDERHRFRVIELDAARPPFAGKLGGGEDDQSLHLGGGQQHASLFRRRLIGKQPAWLNFVTHECDIARRREGRNLLEAGQGAFQHFRD